MRIDVWVLRRKPYPLPPSPGQFLKVIAGMDAWMVLHVKAAAGDEMGDRFLLVFDGLDAKKNGAKSKRGDQENTDQFLLADCADQTAMAMVRLLISGTTVLPAPNVDVKSVAANAESGADAWRLMV